MPLTSDLDCMVAPPQRQSLCTEVQCGMSCAQLYTYIAIVMGPTVINCCYSFLCSAHCCYAHVIAPNYTHIHTHIHNHNTHTDPKLPVISGFRTLCSLMGMYTYIKHREYPRARSGQGHLVSTCSCQAQTE